MAYITVSSFNSAASYTLSESIKHGSVTMTTEITVGLKYSA